MVNTRVTRLSIIALALVVASATVPSRVQDPAVGAITGEMIVRSPDNRTIGKLEATVSYSLPAQAGDTSIRFTPSNRATTVSASAEFTAVRQEEGFGAVSALMLALAGRVGNDRTSLRLSNIRVEGDPGGLRPHVDAIIGWWDEQGGMAVSGYMSPVLDVAHAAKLLLNVWGSEDYEGRPASHGYAVILFDPLLPGHVVGGRVVRKNAYGGGTGFDVPVSGAGQLTARTDTPTPNDYLLTIGISSEVVRVELVIDVLADGSFDVRGAGRLWGFQEGVYTVEGVGTSKFMAPGS